MSDKKLATFKVDTALWEGFQAKVGNASGALKALMQACLDGRISISKTGEVYIPIQTAKPESGIDKGIDQQAGGYISREEVREEVDRSLEPIKYELEALRAELGKCVA